MQGMAGPAPFFVSSGDLIADRRYGYARDLMARGEAAAAADVLQQTVELSPAFASAWFALGEAQAACGRRDEAVAAFRQALACDPEDPHGAALRLARLGAADADTAMSPAYVRSLFEQYAACFDRDLIGSLGYRGPDLLRSAIEAARTELDRPARFGQALDLGCGTGLMGRALREVCDCLIGVDLAPAMIERARRTSAYHELAVGDMLGYLSAQAAHSFDLVVAADSLVYLADLRPLARAAARVLTPGGLFAFSVETHAGRGVVLGDKLRYAHGAEHVREALASAPLGVLSLAAISTRTENGEPVPGLIVVAGPC